MGKKCQYLAQNDQKCILWTKFGRFWASNPNFPGVSKSFGTHIMKKPPRQLVRIVFWSGNRSYGPKMPMFGPKCQFWAKFGCFRAPNPIFWGQGVKLLVPSYQDSNGTPFSCWKHWSLRLQLAARGENVLFWPQNLDLWGQKSIFSSVIAIFVDGTTEWRDQDSRPFSRPKWSRAGLEMILIPKCQTA